MYLFNVYGAFIGFIIIGFCLGRFAKVSPSAPFTLVRYVFLPAIVFTALSQRIPAKTIVLVMLTGAGVASLGPLIISKLGSHMKISSSGGGSPNIAYFTIPMIGLCFGAKGLATACYFLIGVYMVQEGKRGSSLDIKRIAKEPFVIAAVLAIILAYTRWRIPYISKIVNPIYKSSFLMIAIYLGTTFNPNRMKGMENFMPIIIKLASGFLVASSVISLLGFRGIVAKTIMLCALAPPGATVGGDNSDDVDSLGVLICLIIMLLLTGNGWRPWTLRLF